LDGIQIDFSDEQWTKAYSSIWESFDPDSNVRLSSPMQLKNE
jgi:hypothetical protein